MKPKSRSAPKPKAEALVDLPAPLPEPEKAEKAGLRWGWMIWLALGILLLTASIILVHDRQLDGWELRVFQLVNDWSERLRTYFLVASITPESLWIGVASVLVTFLARLYRLAWQLAVAIFGGYALAYVTMQLIGRPRPSVMVDGVHERIHDPGLGFPSGHTMIITVLVLMVWPYLPRGWRWLVAVLVPLMAISRLYLGIHAPLDVVGGFAVGVIVVATMRVLPERARRILKFD